MHGVGFEPTRLSPYDLKSYPLDHSGIHAFSLRTGFEPVALRLTAARSNQLS